MIDQKLHRLADTPFFRTADPRALKEVAALVDEVSVPSGARIGRGSELDREFVLIEDGYAVVSRNNETWRIGPGDVFGEIPFEHCHPNAGGPLDVVAETPVRLLVIDRGAFGRLIEAMPSLPRDLELQAALHCWF